MAVRAPEYYSAVLTIGAIITYSLILICLHKSLPVQAQFFTKTSKSIPRMGRRSDSGLNNPSLLSPHELLNQQSSVLLDYNMQDEMADTMSGKAGLPTIVSSAENGSASSMFVNRTPGDYPSINWQTDQKQNDDSRWPPIVTSQANYYSNTDLEKTRNHNEQNYVGSISNHILANNYGERDRLAMKGLYLARLNQHLNFGQQFLSIPQLMALTQSRSQWIGEPSAISGDSSTFSITRQ